VRVLIACSDQHESPTRTQLVHRPARDIYSPAGEIRIFTCLGDAAFQGPIDQAACGAFSFVQRNSVPSLQMRCMITASRRARATMAFCRPRRLAMFIAQAFNQDHFLVRDNMTCAAGIRRTSCPSSPIARPHSWAVAHASIATKQRGCLARKTMSCDRDSFFRNATLPSE
jgi:hypothetical protein